MDYNELEINNTPVYYEGEQLDSLTQVKKNSNMNVISLLFTHMYCTDITIKSIYWISIFII